VIAVLGMFALLPPSVFSQASVFDPAFRAGAGPNNAVNSVVVQDDGKILIGGEFTEFDGQPCSYLARLNPDGQLDTSFPGGTDGVVYHLRKLLDGRVLVGGHFMELQGVPRTNIARLLSSGEIDPAFNIGTNLEDGERAYRLEIQPDGKVLAGSFLD